MLRNSTRVLLGVPDPFLALLEDYAALRLGCDAAGMSMDEVGHTARESIEDVKDKIMPALQSIGTGSM